MDDAPNLPWGKIAAVTGTVVVVTLVVRGAAAVVSLATDEARYRLQSGVLPKGWR